jgi:membrane associated rhomboid family serine protease
MALPRSGTGAASSAPHCATDLHAPLRSCMDRFSLRTAPVTRALIVANLAVFAVVALAIGVDRAGLLGGLIPGRLSGTVILDGALPPVATILSSAFLHAGPIHLAMNMVILAWLGRMLEPPLGTERFAGLYALALVAAAAAEFLRGPASPHPIVGASGAIAGLFGAHALIQALATRRLRGQSPRPWTEAGRLMLVWTLFQLALGLVAGGGLGIAIWAHIGGFAAGLGWVLARLRPVPQASG